MGRTAIGGGVGKLAAVLIPLAVSCAHDYRRWAPVESEAELRSFVAALNELDGLREYRVPPEIERFLAAGGDGAGRLAEAVCAQCVAGRFYDLFRLRGVRAGASDEERCRAARRNELRIARMYGGERGAIARAGRDPWFGLSLSGGGVRSASFATGVLQGLFEVGLLDRVGYLSTVSGGGYAASWYMTHDVPVGELFEPGSIHLQHLGQNGYYLTPGHFSRSRTQVGFAALLHTLSLPFHWLGNAAFDWDQNAPFFRDWYRAGLQRGYLYDLPTADSGTAPLATSSIAELLPGASCERPYWIVNAHLALSDDRAYRRMRSGDAFEIAPLRSGADAVGYVETERFGPQGAGAFVLRDDAFWMQPTYAVSASGAAVDSKSLRGNEVLDGALQAFNLDLGYYVAGWSHGFVEGDRGSWWRPLHWWATSPFPVYYVLGRLLPFPILQSWTGAYEHDHTRGSRRYYLTDGGHFENLGAYALVRRGCRLIVIADATRDRTVSEWGAHENRSRALAFEDLRRLEILLEADFGARLEMDWAAFDPRVPDDGGGFGSGPKGGVFVGRIRNLPIREKGRPGGDEAIVVYVKAAYSIEDALRREQTYVDALKAEDPDFPNDSTWLQFYTEHRVLAYRALGRALVVTNRDVLEGAAREALGR